ncbi:pilus assembly protein [Budvicia aquatica]|nr:pilus assembly protein [Budvicia aquatica]
MSELKRSRIKFFCHNRRAGVSIMFAIVLPLLLATFSLGIDGSRFLIKRARLADALSQGSFAVASTNTNLTTSQEKTEGKELVRNYINYYLPGDLIDESTLNVQAVIEKDPSDATKINSIAYVATAKIIAHPIIDGVSNALPGFSKDVSIIADENNGIVRRTMGDVNIESDIVFAVDFSGSILDKTEDGKPYLVILREVVSDLATQIVDEASNSKIAIVPFDTGVPTKIEEKNEAGGDRIGCIVPYKLKDKYQIDFSFWANKNVNWKDSLLEQPGDIHEEFIKRYLDLQRFSYYSNTIKAAIGDFYKGFCVSNPLYDKDTWGGNINSNPLSCEAITKISATSPLNFTEIQKSYKIIEDYYDPYLNKVHFLGTTIADETVDVAGTLSKAHLFNDNSMSVFESPFTSGYNGNMFKYMCQSGFNITSPVLADTGVTIPAGHPYGKGDYYSRYLKDVRQNVYSIDLTKNKSEVFAFNRMNPVEDSGTDILPGLLYSAHVAAKGKNPRKLIIIVTDGQTTADAKLLEKRFFAAGMCEKITEGIMNNSPGTKEVKIYFVSTLDDKSVLSDWRENCVGDDGAFVATDYSALKDAITSVLNKEPGGIKFTNKM